MKNPSSRFVPAVAALAFAVAGSLAVATVVEAQTPPAPSGRPMPMDGPLNRGDRGGPGEHGMRGGRAIHMMKEIERLKASLRLNASQSAAWDKAVAQMKAPTNRGEQMKAEHDRMVAALAAPDFNPRLLATDMDRAETERRARMSSIRDAWFSVYDTLDPAQRGQVREFLRERLSHPHDGWKHHGDDEHGGRMRGAQAPDAPAPNR